LFELENLATKEGSVAAALGSLVVGGEGVRAMGREMLG
jgi:hypothetical protein